MLITSMQPIADAHSTVLILGTMPGAKALQTQQYYAHPGNQFWKIICSVFGCPFTEVYSERIAILKHHRIALWEVLDSCERKGSSDSKIVREVPNNIEEFLAKHPGIKYIFFESKSAQAFYHKHLQLFPQIEYGLLPSPSGANARISFTDKVAQWQILRSLTGSTK